MRYADILRIARSHRSNPTKAEDLFWQKVRNRQFYGLKFYRQYIIPYRRHECFKSFFIPDFYNHTHKTIIELDGEIHEFQMEHDLERQAILERLGYSVLRFTNDEIMSRWSDVDSELRKHFGVSGKAFEHS